MSAYVLTEVTLLDEAAMARYGALAEASIAGYGGRYLARGGAVEALEGEWPPERRIVIVEFPTMARAREWYGSPEYAEALEVRASALTRRLALVDGVDPEGGATGGA